MRSVPGQLPRQVECDLRIIPSRPHCECLPDNLEAPGRSGDDLTTDTLIFSANLVISNTFSLNGIQFDFSSLIPHGMTCFEWGQNGSSWEAGNCLAIGGVAGGRR